MTAALCLVLLAAPLPVQKETPDTVRLRFAWPVGLTAQVSTTKLTARTSRGKSDTTRAALNYRLLVQRHPRGRLMRFHDFEVPGVAELADPALRIEDFAEMQERMSGLMPSLVVDTAGAFVAIEGLDAMQREMDSLIPPAQKQRLHAEARALLDRLRSPEMLTTLAEYEWNALVGTWIEADFVVGMTYETEYELPFPLLPGVMLPVIQEFTAIARVPCSAGETTRRCVELESVVHQDRDAFRAIVERIMAQALPGDTGQIPKIESYETETEVRLVTEPGTLIPHVLSVTKRIAFSMREQQGAPMHTSQIETKTTTYVYRQ